MNSKRKRILALLLLAVMLVTFVPSVAATTDERAASAVESDEEVPTTASGEPVEDSTPEPSEEAVPSESQKPSEEAAPAEETSGDDDVPRSIDGEPLTRDENLFPPSAPSTGLILRSTTPILRAAASSTGTVGKSTCVDFGGYTSPYWYCNRYYSEGKMKWWWMPLETTKMNGRITIPAMPRSAARAAAKKPWQG